MNWYCKECIIYPQAELLEVTFSKENTLNCQYDVIVHIYPPVYQTLCRCFLVAQHQQVVCCSNTLCNIVILVVCISIIRSHVKWGTCMCMIAIETGRWPQLTLNSEKLNVKITYLHFPTALVEGSEPNWSDSSPGVTLRKLAMPVGPSVLDICRPNKYLTDHIYYQTEEYNRQILTVYITNLFANTCIQNSSN